MTKRSTSRSNTRRFITFREVDLAWYDHGRLKITIPRGTPGVIRQAYLTGNGRDLIIEVAPRN
jgi:hypothetical protein